MCLTIPYKIISIDGDTAVTKAGSRRKKISTRLVPGLKKDDWVLVSQGSAISKISKGDAEKNLELIRGLTD